MDKRAKGNYPSSMKYIDSPILVQTAGAEYVAVCLPAFSPDSVNRDSQG